MIRELEETHADYWDNYVLKVPYKERKYIMLVEDSKIKNCAVSGITISILLMFLTVSISMIICL